MLLVLASRNAHKARELADILTGWEVEPLATDAEPPEETGVTFAENARLKARFGRDHADADAWVVGEDSGLEVEGLGGAPGVRSARYAGSHGDDCGEPRAAPVRARRGSRARGAAVATSASSSRSRPDGREVAARGELAGRIAIEPRGSEGFGYDPVFVPGGRDAHRGRARERVEGRRTATAPKPPASWPAR